MTLVMVWREGWWEAPITQKIWVVSDSRLSQPGETSGRVRFSDRAAKILEIPVTLYGPNPRPTLLRSATFGFAYTGSTLVALQAYTAILPLWSRLQTSGTETYLPSLEDFADHLAGFVDGYAREIAGSGGDANCQCLLIGRDDPTGRLEAWMIEFTHTSASADLHKRSIKLPKANPVEFFGTGSDAAKKRLDALPPRRVAELRRPLTMIRTLLHDDVEETIGGGVQIGLLSPEGFEVHFDAENLTIGMPIGRPLVDMRFRGFDFYEISTVGFAFSTLRGIGG